jgi:NADPH:quinone reductase-like Zn-dependent oxidoreductase
MAMMKAVTAPPFGGPEAMSLVDMERPVPAAEELLVRVTAIGVNRVDAMQRSGAYAPPPGASFILGVEFAGEVVEAGANAPGFAPGDRVFGLVAAGGYAEYATIHHRHAVRTPVDWDDVKAAAVIETFCTAHETLFLDEVGHALG